MRRELLWARRSPRPQSGGLRSGRGAPRSVRGAPPREPAAARGPHPAAAPRAGHAAPRAHWRPRRSSGAGAARAGRRGGPPPQRPPRLASPPGGGSLGGGRRLLQAHGSPSRAEPKPRRRHRRSPLPGSLPARRPGVGEGGAAGRRARAGEGARSGVGAEDRTLFGEGHHLYFFAIHWNKMPTPSSNVNPPPPHTHPAKAGGKEGEKCGFH